MNSSLGRVHKKPKVQLLYIYIFFFFGKIPIRCERFFYTYIHTCYIGINGHDIQFGITYGLSDSQRSIIIVLVKRETEKSGLIH